MKYIRTEIKDTIATITMCRTEKMNAFHDPFIAEMIAAFQVMEVGNVRAVILRAEKGSEVWSAGRDIDCLPTRAHEIEGWDETIVALGRAVLACPVPVIALVEGSVWGYGCEIAFSCDLVIATPETTFAITPAKLGVLYTLSGLRTVIERLGPNLAKEMLFCAMPMGAERLYAQGVINHVVGSEDIENFVYKVARRISFLAPLSIAALKLQISDVIRAQPLPHEKLVQSKKAAASLLASSDFKEGVAALKTKRQPKFKGY